MKRRLLIWGLPILLALYWVASFSPLNGIWMFWEAKYDEKNLLGLTSAQVIQRLGPPSYDPRTIIFGSTQPSWTDEKDDGPLVLGYYSGWATCAIKFQNDRVVSAVKSEK
jgi:hypothetical protein